MASRSGDSHCCSSISDSAWKYMRPDLFDSLMRTSEWTSKQKSIVVDFFNTARPSDKIFFGFVSVFFLKYMMLSVVRTQNRFCQRLPSLRFQIGRAHV